MSETEPAAATLILQLVSVCERSDGAVLGKDRGRVREIGERLNKIGGWNLMHAAYEAVRQSVPARLADAEGGMPPGVSEFHPSEIAPVWDGIGDWAW